MNPEIKEMWAKALESGDYKQGEGALRVDDGFCCLGVLCDLHAKATGGVWVGSIDPERPSTMGYLGNDEEVLPHVVVEWAGLDVQDPQLNIDGRLAHASNHNDSGKTFQQIAQAIREQL